MEWLDSEEQGDEMLLMGLRLREGIDPRRYASITGRPLNPHRINLLQEQNFLERLRMAASAPPMKAGCCSMRWWRIWRFKSPPRTSSAPG